MMKGNYRHIIACFIVAVFYLETAISFGVISLDFFTGISNVELINDAESANAGKEAEENIEEKSFLQPDEIYHGHLIAAENDAAKKYIDFHARIQRSFLPVFTPPPEISDLF